MAKVVAEKPKMVEKPNREEFDAQVKELDTKIKANKAIVDEITGKLDKLKEEKEKAGEKKDSPEEVKLAELKAATKVLGDARKVLLEQLKKAKATRDKQREEFDAIRKRTRDMDCNSVEQLDKKIRDLEFKMSTNSLTLREEKTVMSEIRNLNANRKVFSEIDGTKAGRDKSEALIKEISEKLDEGKKAYEAARAEEDKQFKIVSKQRDAKRGNRSEVPNLIEKRNKARDELNKLYKAINKLRSEHKAKEDEFRKFLNEKRKEQREAQKAEYEARKEEERQRKFEKEEEQLEYLHGDKLAAIDQLKTYLKGKMADETKTEEEAAATQPKAEEGEVLIGKFARGTEDDDVYGTKKTKGKGKKKGGKGKKNAVFVHDLNTLLEFEKLKLQAPLNFDGIAATIETLDKKAEELKKDKEVQRAKYQAKKAAALEEAAEEPKADADAKKEEEVAATPAATPVVEATA